MMLKCLPHHSLGNVFSQLNRDPLILGFFLSRSFSLTNRNR